MDLGTFLAKATHELTAAGITTARLDCLVVLEDVTGWDRARLLAHPETAFSAAQITKLNKFITQRKKHLPLAYYRGRAAFYGRDFAVNSHVLVPRPESEAIIDLFKKCELPTAPLITDVGTGSGCLGLTAALELPGAQVMLYDIDSAALRVAKQNSHKHQLHNVRFKEQDLLTNCREAFDVVLANLPYVPTDHRLNRAATYEPKLALYSGQDGLDHYRRFWQQVTMLERKPTYIIVESLPEQHPALTALADRAGYKLLAIDGYVLSFEAQRQA